MTVAFNLIRGFSESDLEADVLGGPPQLPGATVEVSGPTSASGIFEAAEAQAVPLILLTPASAASVDALPIPTDAKTLISEPLERGACDRS